MKIEEAKPVLRKTLEDVALTMEERRAIALALWLMERDVLVREVAIASGKLVAWEYDHPRPE